MYIPPNSLCKGFGSSAIVKVLGQVRAAFGFPIGFPMQRLKLNRDSDRELSGFKVPDKASSPTKVLDIPAGCWEGSWYGSQYGFPTGGFRSVHSQAPNAVFNNVPRFLKPFLIPNRFPDRVADRVSDRVPDRGFPTQSCSIHSGAVIFDNNSEQSSQQEPQEDPYRTSLYWSCEKVPNKAPTIGADRVPDKVHDKAPKMVARPD